ncbi:hypothetical protein GCM10007897_20610 [Sphingobium jiangsuense]|nr:hypothetical protein GCM10007897_20610 [Sphingobium jiangsuense]
MNDRNNISAASKGRTRAAHFVTVTGFRHYEGMGRALASAYSAVDQADLPEDMIDLLHQLDSATGTNGAAQG